jgi:hypothetical protein
VPSQDIGLRWISQRGLPVICGASHPIRRSSQDLRQIRTHQVAALVQAMCIALRAVAVEV